MEFSGHGKLPPAHVRHEEYRVDEGIFEFWASPNASFVLLCVFMSLSVAVLFEGRTIVEGVDFLSAFASLSGLTRCLKPRVKNLD